MRKFNKTLSFILAIIVLISSVYVSGIISVTANVHKNWDGTVTQPSGSGTTVDPFIITNAEELAYAVTTSANDSTYYKLANDIYINDDSAEKWYETNGLVSWPDSSTGKFRGTLDGDGHKVYGLYHSSLDKKAGLVPILEAGSTVKNIGIESAFISSGRVGGIFGSRDWANNTVALLENCYVGENVILKGTSFTGGLYGTSTKGFLSIKNCYSLAKLSGESCGGISGDQWGGNVTVDSCYTNSSFTGKNQYLTITNCYSTDTAGTILTASQMQGFNSCTYIANLDWTNSYAITIGYPMLRVFMDRLVKCYYTETISYDIGIMKNTTFKKLGIPKRIGYQFEGFYTDPEYKNKATNDVLVNGYDSIYIKWSNQPLSSKVINNYDDEGVTFTEEVYDGAAKGSKSSLNAKENKGFFSTYDAVVKDGVGVDGSRGIKATRAYRWNYRWPTAFMIYDTNGNAFVPQANANYKISLKYKLSALGNDKSVKLSLREVFENNATNASSTDNITEYGTINKSEINKSTISDEWIETSFEFTANSDPSALFIAVGLTEGGTGNAYAIGLELYIDDIVIEQIGSVSCCIDNEIPIELPISSGTTFKELEIPVKSGYEIEGFYSDAEYVNKLSVTDLVGKYSTVYIKLKEISLIQNTYDEEGVIFTESTYDGAAKGSKSSLNAKENKGFFSTYDAVVKDGVGVDGTRGIKATRAYRWNYRWPTAFMLYDTNGDAFIPQANANYKISLKYKLSALTNNKSIKISLRELYENGATNASATDTVTEYGAINKNEINSSAVSEEWIETSFEFTANSDPNALFIAVCITEGGTGNAYATGLELYIDEIVIEKIGNLTCYIDDKTPIELPISSGATFEELEIPVKSGYEIEGFYTDAEYTNKIKSSEVASNYSAVYIKLQEILYFENTYDENGYTFTEMVYDGNTKASKSNINAKEIGGFFSTYDAVVKDGVGVDGSRGIKVTRAYRWNYRWPTAFMLYDTNGNSFVPKANANYKISLKYKLSALGNEKSIKLSLREVYENGATNATATDTITEYGVINREVINKASVSDEWVETSFDFTTTDDVKSLFIAICLTEGGTANAYATGLELYIDDIVIQRMDKVTCHIEGGESVEQAISTKTTFGELSLPLASGYEIDSFYSDSEYKNRISDAVFVCEYDVIYVKVKELDYVKNTFDEDGVTFKKNQMGDKKPSDLGNYSASTSNLNAKCENEYFSQFDAFVEKEVGVNNSNAIKVTHATGYNWKWPTSFMLYDNHNNAYIPQPNTWYRVSLKYKLNSLKSGKSVNIMLRQTTDKKVCVDYENIVEYGKINSDIITSDMVNKDKWIETSIEFMTLDDIEALYIAVTTTEGNRWWAEELELVIDDVCIEKLLTSTTTEDSNGVWNGNLAGGFAGGNGTEDSPYLVSNAGQLATMIKSNGLGGSYFKLTKDIYLNYTESEDWYKKTTNNPWFGGDMSTSFKGNLDGDGHIVYGLWYPDSTTSETAGLIPTFGQGTIKNIGIRGSYISTQNFGGGLIGLTVSGGVKFIDNCFADETVAVVYSNKENVDALGIGGIIGAAWIDKAVTKDGWLRISNCYSKAVLICDSAEKTNGIIGNSWDCMYTMKNCYSKGVSPYFGKRPRTNSLLYMNADGTLSENAKNVYSNIYSDGRKPYDAEVFVYIENPNNMKGENAHDYMSGLDYSNVFEIVKNNTPKLRVFKSITGNDKGVNMESLSGFAYGRGTKYEPYIITNANQLRKLIEMGILSYQKFFALGNDIYLNDTTKTNWKANNPKDWYFYKDAEHSFAGSFDGKGYSVYGLYLDMTPCKEKEFKQGGTGLFPRVSNGAEIRNVHIRNSYLSSYASVGGIVGYMAISEGNYVKIMGCSVDETVELRGQTVGGIIGAGNKGANLNFCYSTAKLNSPIGTNSHGLIGDIWNVNSLVYQCYSIGYTNFRDGFTPKSVEAVYGTEVQAGTIVLEKAKMLGNAAKSNMELFDWNRVWYTKDGKYPQLNVITYELEQAIEKDRYYDGKKGEIWSGKIARNFAGGTGTESDPYIIETAEQLAKCLNDSAPENTHYKVVADIYLNDTSSANWKEKARNWFSGSLSFNGHIDGDGHVVSGLYCSADDGTVTRVALFPMVGRSAVIEKLGIVNSYINATYGMNQTYAAAFIAFVPSAPEGSTEQPVLSQCFADQTVEINGYFAGGLVCGVAGPIKLENCYFTGSLLGIDCAGSLLGNSWTTTGWCTITNCYATTPNKDSIIKNNGLYKAYYTDVYTDSKVDSPRPDGVEYTLIKYMQGNEAKKLMKGFDFNKIWQTIVGGTPTLRIFASDKYSCTRQLEDTKVDFIVNGGTECEAIYGEPRADKLVLPTPTRYGYEFGGWYHFIELDVPCELEYFPDYDIMLYAKWIPKGFIVDFEGKYDAKYDYNQSVQHHKPGTKGYTTKHNHNGIKSMHCLADGEISPVFLLSYENKLEVGKEYELLLWVNTDTENASGKIELLFSDYPDITASTVTSQTTVEIDGISTDKWQKYTTKFTALSPYVLLKTPLDTSVYFDDIQVVYTGESGKQTISEKTFNTPVIIGISVAAVVFVAGIVTLVIIMKKRNKAK